MGIARTATSDRGDGLLHRPVPVTRFSIHVDRRILLCFMALTIGINAFALIIPWKDIMAGTNDFPIFYSNAQMVREGCSSDLYNFDAENSFVHKVSNISRPPNNHLPYELLLFVPFTSLPLDAAFIVWTCLGFLMLACVAFLMRNAQGGKPGFLIVFLSLLAFYPVWYCLLQGQDSILLLVLFAASFWLWQKGWNDLAGFVLALGLFRPQVVLPFVFVTTVAGKWKFLRGFLPGATLVCAVSVQVAGWHGIIHYLHILTAQGSQESASVLLHNWEIRPELMPTWRGFLWVVAPAWLPAKVRDALLVAGTIAGLLWAARGLRAAKNGVTSDVAFLLSISAAVLVSFHSFLHDFVLTVLPLTFLASLLAASTGISKSRAYCLVTIGLIFFLTPIYLVMLDKGVLGLLALPEFAGLWTARRWLQGTADHGLAI